MNVLPTNETLWDSADAKRLADFLESPTGQRAVQILVSQAPSLLDGRDVNMTLVASGAVKGYGEALRNFLSLTAVQPPQPQPRDTHPDLDNEALWNGVDPK